MKNGVFWNVTPYGSVRTFLQEPHGVTSQKTPIFFEQYVCSNFSLRRWYIYVGTKNTERGHEEVADILLPYPPMKNGDAVQTSY
jgi:hypothetical protein